MPWFVPCLGFPVIQATASLTIFRTSLELACGSDSSLLYPQSPRSFSGEVRHFWHLHWIGNGISPLSGLLLKSHPFILCVPECLLCVKCASQRAICLPCVACRAANAVLKPGKQCPSEIFNQNRISSLFKNELLVPYDHPSALILVSILWLVLCATCTT